MAETAVAETAVGAVTNVMPETALSQATALWVPLRHLWASPPVEEVPAVRWWIEGNRLIAEMKMPLPLAGREMFKTGGFTPELWKQDVAECFLLDRRTGRYTEVNLSPGGAWWAAHFSAPRLMVQPQPPPMAFDVETKAIWTPTHWEGHFSLPLPNPEAGATALNFNAITVGTSAGAYRYFSLASLAAENPDFHLPWEWPVV